MRFAEADKHKDVPRPLKDCGTYCPPGQDARWRDYPWEGGDTVAIREVQRIAEAERRETR